MVHVAWLVVSIFSRKEYPRRGAIGLGWAPILEASQISMLDIIYVRKYLAGNQKVRRCSQWANKISGMEG